MMPAEDRVAEDRVRIHAVREQDLAAVAALHREGLPLGFLSQLGPNVLKVLYRAIGTHDDSTVLVAVEGDTVLGYVSGTTDVRRCYRHVLARSAAPLFVAAAPRLVRPSTLRRVVETLTYPFRFRNESTDDAPRPDCSAELLSIAVHADARGKRVGKRLVAALEDFLGGRLRPLRYRVVTDALDPRSTAFYERVGFARLGEFTNHGHPMVMFVKDVPHPREAR